MKFNRLKKGLARDLGLNLLSVLFDEGKEKKTFRQDRTASEPVVSYQAEKIQILPGTYYCLFNVYRLEKNYQVIIPFSLTFF